MIIRGARQVGKTWLMQEFGRTAFEQCAYINFDHNERMQNLSPAILMWIGSCGAFAIESGVGIDPENTLIILDEIQEVPAALQSLKYFCEDSRHRYYILAAGSLLGSPCTRHVLPCGQGGQHGTLSAFLHRVSVRHRQ